MKTQNKTSSDRTCYLYILFDIDCLQRMLKIYELRVPKSQLITFHVHHIDKFNIILRSCKLCLVYDGMLNASTKCNFEPTTS